MTYAIGLQLVAEVRKEKMVTVTEVGRGRTRRLERRSSGFPRRLIALVAVLALLGAGCAGPAGEEAASGGGESAEGAFPVTIEHKYGSTTIEREPQRVVALGLTDVDPILALGVIPVGFIDWYGEYPKADIRNSLWPWAHELVGDAEPVVMPRNEDKFNFEAIAALRPDILIAQYTGMTREEYELASQIAPTVGPSPDFPDFETPWDVTTRRIGEALGRSERAEELIEGVKNKFAQAREAHPEFQGQSAMLVDYFEGVIYVRGPNEPHGKVLAELGFDYPAALAELIPEDNVLAELSLEQIELFDEADVLLISEFATDGEVTQHPLYLALDIVREGRVVPSVEPIEGALYWASVASLPFAIDQLVPLLAAAVDGDPATEVPVPQ